MASAAKPSVRPTPKIQNILYTTDFTHCSESAAPYVSAIARQYGSTVHVLHVLSPEPVIVGEYGVSFPELDADREMAVRRRLDDVCQSRPFEGVLSTQTLETGEAGEVAKIVAELVPRMNIDLIVMGTHGRRGLKQLLIGSVAEQVLRRAQCPVLTVGPELHRGGLSDRRLSRILYATNLPPVSPQALQYALFFAGTFNGQLRLVHAVRRDEVLGSDFDAISQAREALANLMTSEPDIIYSVTAKCKPAASLILDVSKKWKADLIIMGAHHGASGSAHSPWAVAHRVMSNAWCPVLTVPA